MRKYERKYSASRITSSGTRSLAAFPVIVPYVSDRIQDNSGVGREEIARLGEDLGVFSRRYYDWLGDRLRDLQVNPGRRKMMRLLRENGPMKMSNLAGELQLDPKRLTTMVDMLEDAGFVRRVTEPADRRARNVELTPDGDAAWDEINDAFVDHVSELIEGMTPAELAQLSTLIRRMTERIHLSTLPD